jgi:hypothetical protein
MKCRCLVFYYLPTHMVATLLLHLNMGTELASETSYKIVFLQVWILSDIFLCLTNKKHSTSVVSQVSFLFSVSD